MVPRQPVGTARLYRLHWAPQSEREVAVVVLPVRAVPSRLVLHSTW